ncbi:anthranilate synthase component I family protein [Fulvivirga maritima]|uniref:anthranilate synthase component I family protein n=1 Tax=Fulvivirga maritima TaxID=2904247 RepID=UPI001F238F39|nr:anthranilate synthase component I family protein [Fulvivirga maritima]UII26680.1 anthranilate synthase component I family protein [Fulvivirga maritima]
MTIKLNTTSKKLLADTLTPVSIYLRLRDKFAQSILLESSDYHGTDNSFSYICCSPIASFKAKNNELTLDYPGKAHEVKQVDRTTLLDELNQFKDSFSTDPSEYKFVTNGLFGYMAYDGVQYFEDVDFKNDNEDIPDIFYTLYRFVIVVDHFKNELYLFEHSVEGEGEQQVDIQYLESLININSNPKFHFQLTGDETSNYTDAEFLDILSNGRSHCHRGDVFQIVLSRRFQSKFSGDEFNVYRALRSINPSPYLFYFDYGTYKIFGSSPESQIVIKDGEASIFPIAGTFRRTGNDTADAELATKLFADEKENSEHVMLVDLARNDLSRSSEKVEVEVFKEIQYYSHVIHLVSKVTGKLAEGSSPLKLVADTFPAGTLSGAPKHMAMKLIDKYENRSRSYYGGAIGFIGFNGDFNHAIMIRSFLSKENELHYQAGAGVVAKSSPDSELQEVNNKLAALRNALSTAETINR